MCVSACCVLLACLIYGGNDAGLITLIGWGGAPPGPGGGHGWARSGADPGESRSLLPLGLCVTGSCACGRKLKDPGGLGFQAHCI